MAGQCAYSNMKVCAHAHLLCHTHYSTMQGGDVLQAPSSTSSCADGTDQEPLAKATPRKRKPSNTKAMAVSKKTKTTNSDKK
jgi:hypothetical protein